MKQLILPAVFLGLLATSALTHFNSNSATALAAKEASIIELAAATAPMVAGTFPTTWIHGGDAVNDPKTQVHAYNQNTFILRQSKFETYEAPFMYLLFGDEYVLLMDTGANPNTPVQPLVDRIIRNWLERNGKTTIKLIVQHSHGHFDHVQGDSQFIGAPYVEDIHSTVQAPFENSWGFQNYPNDTQEIDLGGRIIDVLGTPGHHPASVTLYDRNTRLLLTADIVYPGHLFIFSPAHWPIFKNSINRLVDWAATHPVEWVVGCHVEFSSTPFKSYVYGTLVQPDEHVLQFKPTILVDLLRACRTMDLTPSCKKYEEFVIHPVYLCGITWN